MSRIALAFRLFFRALAGEIPPSTPPPTAPATPSPDRSALLVLATLQREARLIDFLMEPLDGYTDAQIGAAARDVHRDAAGVLRRLFAPEPLRAEAEGATVIVPRGFDPAVWKLTGRLGGEMPRSGILQHPGWRATRCELPQWTGSEEAARILAPAEVELS